MNEWVCDDREDVSEIRKKICAMSDEEFEAYNKMSLSQLKELANKNTPEERIREILASVDGLHLLGGG